MTDLDKCRHCSATDVVPQGKRYEDCKCPSCGHWYTEPKSLLSEATEDSLRPDGFLDTILRAGGVIR